PSVPAVKIVLRPIIRVLNTAKRYHCRFFYFGRREVQALKEFVSPLHKLAAAHEMIGSVYQVINTDQCTRTIERRFVPAQRIVNIQLRQVLARPALNLPIFFGEMRIFKAKIDPSCKKGKRAAKMRKNQYQVGKALEQTAVQQFHR